MHKILYVEDNEDTAEAVRMILTSNGYTVNLANSGSEGLAKGKSFSYDLILIDYMLPDITGWDIFESLRLKTKSKFAFLTIINPGNDKLSLMKDMGLSDYIIKPFSKQDLLKRINKILKGGKKNDKNIICGRQ